MANVALNDLVAALQAANVGGGGTKKVNTFTSAKPNDWIIWKRHLRTCAEINGWNDLRTRREAQAAIMGEAGRLVQDINCNPPPVPGQPPFNLDALLAQYEAKFMPAVESDLAISAFEVSTQEAQESPIIWASRVRELFQRAYPGVPVWQNRILINRFICGLRDQSVAGYVHEQRPQTFDEANEMAQRKTASRLFLASNWHGASGRGRGGIQGVGNGAGNNANLACYECGEPHFRRNCPKIKGKEGANAGPKRQANGRFVPKKAVNQLADPGEDDPDDDEDQEGAQDDEENPGEDIHLDDDDQGNF